MKYKFIQLNRLEFPMKKMCQILKISRSGCYNWKNKEPGNRYKENVMMLNRIKVIYGENKGRYSSIRITKQLKKEGVICGKNRIAKLMSKNNLRAKTKKRFKITTNSKHKYQTAPNVLKQDFTAKTINQKWVSDITYIYTNEGWLYLASILDLCSKKIAGLSFSSRLTGDITVRALEQAITKRGITNNIILHSDSGIQYSYHDYRSIVTKYNFVQSMSDKGNCYDNAIMESFFKTLKTELVYGQTYLTRDEAKKNIFEYIEVY